MCQGPHWSKLDQHSPWPLGAKIWTLVDACGRDTPSSLWIRGWGCYVRQLSQPLWAVVGDSRERWHTLIMLITRFIEHFLCSRSCSKLIILSVVFCLATEVKVRVGFMSSNHCRFLTQFSSFLSQPVTEAKWWQQEPGLLCRGSFTILSM
jgi:hypothetical protein